MQGSLKTRSAASSSTGFKKIKLKGRRIYLSFDSDADNNPNVREARRCLATLLTAEGATVYIVKLHPICGPHTGIDDLCGIGALAAYLHSCETAKPFTESGEWPEPKPFQNSIPPVPTMTADMLPAAMREYVGRCVRAHRCSHRSRGRARALRSQRGLPDALLDEAEG